VASGAAIKLGLLGLGTVGGGTVRVLGRNAGEIARRAGRDICVHAACVRDPAKHRELAAGGLRLGADPAALVRDPEIDILVELIGGIEPARSLILEAIGRGKHVVTANKALIALHGAEIFAAAQRAGVMVAFEAAVAGGIPIIKTLRESLAGNAVGWVAGIINGTCNYILSQMREQGADFDSALAEAQRLGYAEADPGFDVDGIDAAHKLTILGAIAFGTPLAFDAVHVEGIRAITRDDVLYADQLGYRIKHLGIARRRSDGIELRVHPTLVPQRRLIASVEGVMNAVLVHGDAVGPLLLYGAGAGAEPTASSVVADIVDVARALTADPENQVPHLAFQPDAIAAVPLLPMSEVRSAYYLRLRAMDKPGVLAEVTHILGAREISIEAIWQKEPQQVGGEVPVVILTHVVTERAVDEAIAAIEALAGIRAPVARIRLESLA